jgi:ABC-type nitrate/sulfonate/bicarbonate transport system ATPase subunit
MALAAKEAVMPEPKLVLDEVAMTFLTGGKAFEALSPVSIQVGRGRFVSLIGPSGCGKSTLFNIVAGLLAPSRGTVRVDGEDVTGLVGGVGYMLQKDLLLPWRTVLDNVALGMEIRGAKLAAARAKALPYLERYGLGGFEYRYPSALSGGMRQRAALLRTLLIETDIILLDEPFGALDALTKQRMQEWLLTLWSDFGKTIVFITHDVEEAVFLSDEIFMMAARPGRVVDHLTVPLDRPRPRSVLASPAFIALKQKCLSVLSDGADAALEAAA